MSHWYVAIGASGADGLNDIKDVLRNLPAPLNAVVLIVLHRLWKGQSKLVEVLGRASQMPVKIARDGEKFEVGTVYVGEPADHLTLAQNSFGLLPRAELGGLLRFRFALSATAMMVGSAIAPMLFGGMGPAATILLAGGTITLIGGWGFFFSPKLVSPPSAG